MNTKNTTGSMDLGGKGLGKPGLSQVDKQVQRLNLAAKSWFLTFPQCPVSKEAFLKYMETKDLDLQEYIICEEKHENGDPHLHAYLKFGKRLKFKADRFDFIDLGKEYHGHYEICKSWRAVQEYVKKDKNYITNINVEAAKQKQSKKLGIAELERDALDLLEEGVISGFQLTNFLKNQNTYRLLKNKRLSQKEGFDLNIEKKRHHWYYGESNSGKTYRLRTEILKNPEDWFQIPTNNDWVGYNNEKNLYLDEYKGQLTIQELNRICDGGAKVNVKGGTVQLKSDCVVWIVSNFNIKECYKKAAKEENIALEGLYNRFNQALCSRYEKKDGTFGYDMIE